MTKWRCVRTGELQHHGTKGMKWGRRLYQYKDGSLTPAGKLRYGNSKDYEELNLQVTKADSFIKTAKKYQSEKDHKEYEAKIKDDLSKMSDKELQRIVNRLNMEERYTQVMRSREKDAGESAAMKWLQAAGTVTTVAGSALAIAIQMKQVMEMSKK